MRIISAVLLLSFVALLFAAISSGQPPLEVRNDARLPVRSVRVEVAGSATELPGLFPGETLRLPLSLRGDGPLRVHVRFENGRQITVEGGWFTPAMAGMNILTIVSPDSLLLSTRQG